MKGYFCWIWIDINKLKNNKINFKKTIDIYMKWYYYINIENK